MKGPNYIVFEILPSIFMSKHFTTGETFLCRLSFESRDEDLVAEAVAAAEAHITFLSDDMIKSSGPESP